MGWVIQQHYRDISKLSLTSAIFNISEPIIFGLPIFFNISLIIPFILAPIFSLTVAYFTTSLGWIKHEVIQIPWTTSPVVSDFLTTGGDWRASFLQVVVTACSVFIYFPFYKIDEKVS